MARQFGRFYKVAAALVLVTVITACSATYRNHGYVPDEADLQQLVVGVDTRASVEEAVGQPSAGGVLRGNAWYYVSSRVEKFAYRAPRTIERQVVAISFAEDGTVSNIERFGLEDGRVVPLSRRVTETSIREPGLLQALLRNFGQLNIGEALADN